MLARFWITVHDSKCWHVKIINKPIVQRDAATLLFHWGQWMFPLKGWDLWNKSYILRSERSLMSKLVCFVLKMGHSIAFPGPTLTSYGEMSSSDTLSLSCLIYKKLGTKYNIVKLVYTTLFLREVYYKVKMFMSFILKLKSLIKFSVCCQLFKLVQCLS